MKYRSFTTLEPGQVVYMKKCYNKFTGLGRVQHKWNNDGPHGIEDPHTSEYILLDWLMVPGNYSLCLHGKDNPGAKKKQIGQLIEKEKVHQDGKQVVNKICHFKEQFHGAHDWTTTETGASLQATDMWTFENSICKICPYYFDLMGKYLVLELGELNPLWK